MKRRLTWSPKPWMVLAIFVLLWPYEVSFGDTGVSFTLVNRTGFFLHAVINNQTFVYIPPGTAITHETNAYYDVTAEVTYSPGQARTGRALRTFQTVVHTVQTGSYSSNASNDCSGSHQSNTCVSATSVEAGSTTSTTIDPITWVVTADTLSSH